ncbi:MAG: EAL domain-containing protein [Croceibacterium sp.]
MHQPSAPTPNAAWQWLELRDTAALRGLPADWVLHLDKIRFDQIAIIATTRAGHAYRTQLPATRLGDNWAPGGVMAFRMAPTGSEIANLRIGFEGRDDISLLRKVTALTARQADHVGDGWLILMGVFSGLLASAFVYALFAFAGERYPFHRWYLAWVATALLYGLTWTNLAALVVPALDGPAGVRLDSVLVGLVVACGCQFFLDVIERGKIPPWLRATTRAIGAITFLAGTLAADERLLNAHATDVLLNCLLTACVGLTLLGVIVAIMRGSRVVWWYLSGWAPVIAVLALRVARNFGLMGQSDLVDMGTFASMGLESLVFSLLIAGRFVSLRRERDSAEASARHMEVERETLRRAAHADFLTGLGNRAFFHDRMRALLAEDAPFTLFLLDIDFLKELNDRLGHDAGDALLQHVGSTLVALEGDHACCARIGGDEFAVLHLGTTLESTGYAERLEGIQGSVWGRQTWSGILSLSIGRADSDGTLSAAELFQRADIALYEAKKLGRGRLQSFDDRLQRQIQTRIELIETAHGSLRDGHFTLHYQPIVDVRSSSLVSVEALLRWNHPTKGLIGPAEFHPVLADMEIAPALQQHVIAMAIAELHRRPSFPGTLAVNFTAMDLRGREAAEKLLAKLAVAGVAPSSLCIEVIEGIILGKGGTEPAEALRTLHSAGVRIALDDFGTGYASLLHLKEIPVNTLKIDKSFVAGLLVAGDESEEIVRAVLALGHGLRKSVVAEGVETMAQLLRLRELGCDLAQGYLFGRPSPAFPSYTSIQVAA